MPLQGSYEKPVARVAVAVAGAVMALVVLTGAKAQAPASVPIKTMTYRIERNGQDIGRHKVVVSRAANGDFEADIDVRIRVKFAFITAFRLDHTAHERWSADGKLIDMVALTRRGSGTFDVKLAASDGGYVATVNGATEVLPPHIVPTSFTIVGDLFNGEEHKVVLLDTLSGLEKPSIVHPRPPQTLVIDGRTVEVRYFEITLDETGDVTHRIWIDQDVSFAKIGLNTKDGHYIEYFRVPSDDRTG